MVQKGPKWKMEVKKISEVTERVEPPVGSSIERKNDADSDQEALEAEIERHKHKVLIGVKIGENREGKDDRVIYPKAPVTQRFWHLPGKKG